MGDLRAVAERPEVKARQLRHLAASGVTLSEPVDNGYLRLEVEDPDMAQALGFAPDDTDV